MNTNPVKSRALEVNIADYSVDVTIDPKYHVVQEVMAKYYGLQEGLTTYLKELCHPYKNWQFIVNETRNYGLNYFYVLKTHPEGPQAAELYVEICLEAMQKAKQIQVRFDAFSNLYHLCQKFIKETDTEMHRFLPVLAEAFNKIRQLPDDIFVLVAKSYYQLKKLGQSFLESPEQEGLEPLNALLIRYFDYTFSYWLSEPDPREWFVSEIDHSLLEETNHFFDTISRSFIQHCQSRLEGLRNEDLKSVSVLKQLLELLGYGDFVSSYNAVTQKFSEAPVDEKQKNQYKLIFLSHSM